MGRYLFKNLCPSAVGEQLEPGGEYHLSKVNCSWTTKYGSLVALCYVISSASWLRAIVTVLQATT